jgi:hypothetical protein
VEICFQVILIIKFSYPLVSSCYIRVTVAVVQWWLMVLSYDRTDTRIILQLMRRHSRAFLSAQPSNHLCYDIYTRVKFSDISHKLYSA